MKYSEAQALFARTYWESLLKATQGDVSAAARYAGVRRNEVYPHVHRHKLEHLLRGKSWGLNQQKIKKMAQGATRMAAHMKRFSGRAPGAKSAPSAPTAAP